MEKAKLHHMWQTSGCKMWVRVTSLIYLACKDSTQTNYDQDVEDSWAHDCADANVTFSDEDTWKSAEDLSDVR